MLILTLALLAADPTATQPAPPTPATPPAPEDKQICKTMPRELGSMMSGKKRCMTRAQWKEESRRSMDGQRSPRNDARWVGGN